MAKAILPWETSDVHCSPVKVISLENTLNGTIMPLAEVEKISAFARKRGILMHLDGARLWEAAAAGAGSLVEYCRCFDTVTLCFNKGLGAPVGSILVGDKEKIRHARWIRKSIGGGLRQPGMISAAARVAVDETFGRGPNGEGGLLRRSHENAKSIEKMWTALGGKLEYPVETNMCWLDLEGSGVSVARLEKLGQEAGIRLAGNRVVVNYQVSEEALQRLKGVFEKALLEKGEEVEANGKVNRYGVTE